jgi:hypothetical protein
MLRSPIVSTDLRSVLSAVGNWRMPPARRCCVALAACASGCAAGGPPFHYRAAEHRRAFSLRRTVERCVASVPSTSFAAMPVANRSQRCIGGIRCVRRVPFARQRLLRLFITPRRTVVATHVHLPQPRFAVLHFVDPVRALTLRSTGPAGTCLDLRSPSARRAGYLYR